MEGYSEQTGEKVGHWKYVFPSDAIPWLLPILTLFPGDGEALLHHHFLLPKNEISKSKNKISTPCSKLLPPGILSYNEMAV